MPDFNNLSSLFSHVRKTANDVLKKDVAPIVKDIYKETIQSEVYDSYSPTVYQRRGSLIDDSNYKYEIISDGELEVTNVAVPNESVRGYSIVPSSQTMFIRWIESGSIPNIFNMYESYPWTQARPVTQHTIEKLQIGKQHMQALRNGMRIAGINIE